MKFFNCLDLDTFKRESLENQDALLMEKGLYIPVKGVKFEINMNGPEGGGDWGITEIKRNIQPVQPLIDEFYEFMLSNYWEIIRSSYRKEITDFDEKMFGLKEDDVRREAISFFKDIYFKHYNKEAFLFIERSKGKNYNEIFEKDVNCFEFMDKRQRAIKRSLADCEYIAQYLCGNKAFFDQALHESNDMIECFINFEIDLKLMKDLNDRFHFEGDRTFSKEAKLRRLYESKYSLLFRDFELFQFVHSTILSFKKDKIPSVNSFFLALAHKGYLVEGKPKDFIDYVKKEFGLNFTRIKKNSQKDNQSHHDRIDVLKGKIEKYEGAL